MNDEISPVPDSKQGQYNDPYFTVEQAADRLKLSRETLDRWRRMGRGPLFRDHGRRIVYHIDDIDRWSDAQLRQTARKYAPQSLSVGEAANTQTVNAERGDE